MTSSDDQVDSELCPNIEVSLNDDDRDLTISSSHGDLVWTNSVDSNEGAAAEVAASSEPEGASPPSPRTNADLAVEYFLKSLGDKEGYLRNINKDQSEESKAEKELIKFYRNCGSAKSAENLSGMDDEARRRSPRCSCMMHSEGSEASSSQVLWEVQGASTSSEQHRPSLGSGARHGDELFGRLKKSPTDGSLCFDEPKKMERMGSMSWDMSMSLDTLSKKSSSAIRRLTKSESKKQRHGSQDREKGHQRKWLDWQLF